MGDDANLVWGSMDANGKLTPVHFTSEYMDALHFFKKLYDEKLINQDFAVIDSAKWVEPLASNQAGVVLGEADGVVPFENWGAEAMKKLNKPELKADTIRKRRMGLRRRRTKRCLWKRLIYPKCYKEMNELYAANGK